MLEGGVLTPPFRLATRFSGRGAGNGLASSSSSGAWGDWSRAHCPIATAEGFAARLAASLLLGIGAAMVYPTLLVAIGNVAPPSRACPMPVPYVCCTGAAHRAAQAAKTGGFAAERGLPKV